MNTVKKIINYNLWANLEFQKTFTYSPQYLEDDKINDTLKHILYAEYFWMQRLHGFSMAKWPDFDFTFEKLIFQSDELAVFAQAKSEIELKYFVTYKNTKGELFKKSIADILVHVSNHSTYHRGQINARLRSLDADVNIFSTDYIYYDGLEETI